MVNTSPAALRALIRLTLGICILLILLLVLWQPGEDEPGSDIAATREDDSPIETLSATIEWQFPGDLGVNSNVRVEEEIVFRVETDSRATGFKRALQDFALDRQGTKMALNYDNFQIDLDREPEVGGLENQAPFLLIRSGKSGQYLSPGTHKLTLNYSMRGAVSAHEDGVEFHSFPAVHWVGGIKQLNLRALVPRTVDSNFIRPYFALLTDTDGGKAVSTLLHGTAGLTLRRVLDDKVSRLDWSLQSPVPSNASLRVSLFWPRGAFLNEELPSRQVVVP